jgi:solute carrier family 35 protein F5
VLLTINALIGTVISDYCWARSVVLLGPLMTTLGITLTFPISLFIDICYHGKRFTWLYLLGSACIFAAFGVITFKNIKRKEDTKQ